MRCFKCDREENSSNFKCNAPGNLCVLHEIYGSTKRRNQWLNLLVAGVQGSGKTHLIYSLIDQLTKPDQDLKTVLDRCGLKFSHYSENKASQRAFGELKSRLDHFEQKGTMIGESDDPFILTMNHQDERPVHLAIFNMMGEAFESTENMAKHRQILSANAILIMLDPTQMAEFNTANVAGINGRVINNNWSIIENLFEILEAHNPKRVRLPHPVAICLSKFDLLHYLCPTEVAMPYAHPISLFDSHGKFKHSETQKITSSISKLLGNRNYEPLDSFADYMDNFALFGVAPIGHDEFGNKREPTPIGVLVPIFWILAMLKILKSSE